MMQQNKQLKRLKRLGLWMHLAILATTLVACGGAQEFDDSLPNSKLNNEDLGGENPEDQLRYLAPMTRELDQYLYAQDYSLSTEKLLAEVKGFRVVYGDLPAKEWNSLKELPHFCKTDQAKSDPLPDEVKAEFEAFFDLASYRLGINRDMAPSKSIFDQKEITVVVFTNRDFLSCHPKLKNVQLLQFAAYHGWSLPVVVHADAIKEDEFTAEMVAAFRDHMKTREQKAVLRATEAQKMYDLLKAVEDKSRINAGLFYDHVENTIPGGKRSTPELDLLLTASSSGGLLDEKKDGGGGILGGIFDRIFGGGSSAKSSKVDTSLFKLFPEAALDRDTVKAAFAETKSPANQKKLPNYTRLLGVDGIKNADELHNAFLDYLHFLQKYPDSVEKTALRTMVHIGVAQQRSTIQ